MDTYDADLKELAQTEARHLRGRVITWVDHPSYDNKRELIESAYRLVGAVRAYSMVAANGGDPTYHFIKVRLGVDVDALHELIELLKAFKASDRHTKRTLMTAIAQGMIVKEKEENR